MPGKSHGRRSLVGYSPWGRKESDTTERATSLHIPVTLLNTTGFPGGSVGKEAACNAGDASDAGLIPGLGRFPGGGHGNTLQYSSLDNSHGQRSLVGCSPWGRKESDKTERLSTAQMLNTGVIMAYNSPR